MLDLKYLYGKVNVANLPISYTELWLYLLYSQSRPAISAGLRPGGGGGGAGGEEGVPPV
jgi:hypothetical protein